MVRPLNPNQQKLAEKLTILNDRGIGMLTRVYNIKKACGDPKSKPSFLSDKTLESAIKHVVRKFPVTETKVTTGTLGPVFNIKAEIMKSLSLYYYTFVDLLDLKDHISELLTAMDQCQLSLEITVNYDLAKGYLDLVVCYVSLMVLLSRVEDRKAVLGLFNTAHEMTNGQGDASFPRLGQMIIDYEVPMKKLSEEFVPHSKLLYQALISLHKIFTMRNLPAEEWRKSQILSLVSNPNSMLNPAQTDVIQCEYLSLDSMERYLYFGFLLIHGTLSQGPAQDLFNKALHCGWVTTLFRDEVIHTHQFAQTFFEGIKGYNKRVSDIKEAYNSVSNNAANIHRERRKFLRSALKELGLILSDQPGLLGPKALLVFMALSFARDEILWLLRHYDNPRVKKGAASGKNAVNPTEELMDRQLPELLFHVEELRGLIRKYNQVIQRYYVQYLTGYDAIALNQIMQNISMMPEEDSVLIESAYQTISNLSIRQVESNELFDFRGLRLDWFRLQAYTSVTRYPMHLFDHRDLAILMNQIVYHTKLVDSLHEMLHDTSDLSAFCFYSRHFDEHFHMCLEFPAQARYIIAFPLVCGHFISSTHELCPEERCHIGDRSITLANGFLDEISREIRNIITTICDQQYSMAEKLLPCHVAPQIAQVVNKKKSRDKKTKILAEEDRPGSESYRRTREELTTMDKLHMALTELCFAINYTPHVHVWEHTFAPKEYLAQHLESRFAKSLVGMVMFNAETNEISKPTELLHSIRSYMNVLQTIENYVNIDITRIFNNVLLQQTQPQDSNGEKTITYLYTNWYTEVLLRKVSTGSIVYSPTRKVFVSLSVDPGAPFYADEYSDGNELRALTELIGPYGMKHLGESLMWHITSQVTELKKLVVINKDTLIALRSNHDKPENMKELFKRLTREYEKSNIQTLLSCH